MCIQNKKSRFLWLLILVGMVVFPTFSVAATLHVLIVGDTNDPGIGESVKVDIKNLNVLVEDIAKHTGLILNKQDIEGNGLNRDAVDRAVNKISPDSNDVVFFYWSGHGFNDGKSVLPTMYLGSRANGLPLLGVANTIREKKPRLFIVIGDTCNVKKETGSRDLPLSRERAKPENYKVLFLQYRGEVLAAGSEAKEGGYSYGNKDKGGYYTNAFLNSLRTELASDSRPSWRDLMMRTKEPIPISGGIIQQPIVNATQTFFIEEGSTILEQPPTPITDCDRAKAMGTTCGAAPDDEKIPPPTGECTNSSDPKCWGQ